MITRSIASLRILLDYQEAVEAKNYLVMGRAQDIAPYRNYKKYPEYVGRVLNPERRDEEYTLEKNMAFWAGGMESGKKFLILTPLEDIYSRAKRGLTFQPNDSGYPKLGNAVSELLWLEDNGYQFVVDEHNSHLSWAIPPKDKIVDAVFKSDYGVCTDLDAQKQVERVGNIARQMIDQRPENHNPRKRLNTWGSGFVTSMNSNYKSSRSSSMTWRQSDIGGNGSSSENWRSNNSTSNNTSNNESFISWKNKK